MLVCTVGLGQHCLMIWYVSMDAPEGFFFVGSGILANSVSLKNVCNDLVLKIKTRYSYHSPCKFTQITVNAIEKTWAEHKKIWVYIHLQSL